MTRQEEIHKKAESVANRFSYRNGYSTPKDAFIEGVRWADNNQINPWHKASDELPKGRGMYLVWITDYEHPVTLLFNGDWDIHFGEVTHWMEIPELPKED